MDIIKTNFEYRKPLISLELGSVFYIVIHHLDWLIASPEEIHEDVLNDPEKFDWAGFPYNEYIRKDGTVYIGRGDFIGAQCQDYNSTSYGIACEGDYNYETDMPEVQKQSLVKRIKFNKSKFPSYKLTVPHSYLYNTTCPGKYFPMAEILKRVEAVVVEEFKPVDQNFKNCVDLVTAKCELTSPEHWLNHPDPYVKTLIEKMANYIYTVSDV